MAKNKDAETKNQTPPAGATSDAPQGGGAPVAAPTPPQSTEPKGQKEAGPVPGLAIGRIVHFHKEQVDAQGRVNLKPFAAIITDISKGNFQPKDGAVNLTVFISHGGVVEPRHDILFSERPSANRWSFPPKV